MYLLLANNKHLIKFNFNYILDYQHKKNATEFHLCTNTCIARNIIIHINNMKVAIRFMMYTAPLKAFLTKTGEPKDKMGSLM